MTITTSGRDFTLMNVTLSSTADTAVSITTGYTPATPAVTPISGYTAQVINNVNSIAIQCRTAVDIQLRKVQNDANFFTIKSGTVFILDMNTISNTPGTINPFFLRSSTGSPVAEILLYLE